VDASTLTTAVFELVQQFYHATEIGNAATAVSADQPQQTKQRQLFPIKFIAEHNFKTCVVDERYAKSGEMVSGCRR